MDKRLDEIFATYAGKPVKNPDRLTCDICETTYALENEVRALGYDTRVTYPGAMLTMDFNRNRVNIELGQPAVPPSLDSNLSYIITGGYRFG